jgi:hypothetical protein
MKHRISLTILFALILITKQGIAQVFYAKFDSDTAKARHICNVYVSGYKDQSVYSTSLSVPFDGFFPFKCDSSKSLYLSIDCIPVGFTLKPTFNCGDSVIINVDKRTVKYLKR